MNKKTAPTRKSRPRWQRMRTQETKQVEQTLRQEFPQTDAYRYNSASIRVRIVDPRFEHKSAEDRDAMVEPWLERLPETTQADIMNLLTLAPEETSKSLRALMANNEFDDPSPSML